MSFTAQFRDSFKFVCCTSALETKILEYSEWSRHIQAVYVHLTGLANHMMGVILFIDGHRNAIWIIGNLRNSIYNKTVILAAVVGSGANRTQDVDIYLNYIGRFVVPKWLWS